MRVVAFINRKGGVSKTSSCMHLSWPLAQRGRRVLLVDLDSQANLTEGMLGLAVASALRPRQTVAALFDEAGGPSARELVVATPFAGVSILPGHDATEEHYVKRPWETGPLQYTLRDALAELEESFDIVLCDCPPNVLLTSWAALAAADGVVVPLLAEEFAAGGVAKVQEPIRRALKVNPGLRVLGYLLTMFNKSLMVHLEYEADLRQTMGADVFDAVVPLAKDFKEAVGLKKPVGVYKPRSAAARAIDALAVELLHRLERADSEGRAA